MQCMQTCENVLFPDFWGLGFRSGFRIPPLAKALASRKIDWGFECVISFFSLSSVLHGLFLQFFMGSVATKKPCIEPSELKGPLKAQPVSTEEHVVMWSSSGEKTQGVCPAHIRPESSARERAKSEGER